MEELKIDPITKPQSCGLATWSLILGIAGFFLCFGIPSLLAIIFGIIGLVKINAGKGLLTGKGKAITGIILGGLWFVIMPVVIIIAIAIPSFVSSRESARHQHRSDVGLLRELDANKSGGGMSNLMEPANPKPPELMSGRTLANEISAVASLRNIAKAEAVWRQQDADGNGQEDYWTYDVSGLYRILRADGLTKCEFIPLDIASADASPADAEIFGDSRLAQRLSAKTMSKYGYLFEAMAYDESGELYNQEMINNIPAANKTKFAFIAYPETYGKTGSKIFIINESGTVYETDPGSNQAKTILQWPGPDPAEVTGPAGVNWSIVPD